MPFKIVRNDITKVKADVIVNTANPNPICASGTDLAIYEAAGKEKLLAERAGIGKIARGDIAVTGAYNLKAKYIIHTVGPVWTDGKHHEFEILENCYRKSLQKTLELECESIAFPLISTGVYGFPKDKALQIAVSVFSQFLTENEIEIILVVEKKKGYALDMTFPTGEATIYYYAPFFWSNGGDFVSKDGLKVNGVFNSKENLETVNYFKSFLDNGYMSKVQITDLFESGRAAFKFDGAWEVNTIYNNYPDVNLGVAPYVVSDNWDGGRYTPTGSWAFAASSKTKKLKGATKLVQWMSGIESGKRLWDESKSFPSTYEAFESSPIFEEDENYKALYHQLSKYGHPRSKTPVYPQVSASVQEVLENSVLTDKDAKTELDKSVERINAKLKRYVMK